MRSSRILVFHWNAAEAAERVARRRTDVRSRPGLRETKARGRG